MTLTSAIARHILLFEAPRPRSVDARHGLACVWCGSPATPAGVDLGGADGYRPHACPACYRPRAEWLIAYYGWLNHRDAGCQPCGAARPCMVAHGYRVRLMAAHTALGREAVRCLDCEQVIAPADLIAPRVEDGDSGPVLTLAHVRSCPTRRS